MTYLSRIQKVILAAALFLLLSTDTADAACPSIAGKLQGLEHDIAGQIRISEDCSLSATGFSYDGQAPKVFWWGAPGKCSAGTLKKEGRRISNQQLVESYNNEEVCTMDAFKNNSDNNRTICFGVS
jgi:hypothetical protein